MPTFCCWIATLIIIYLATALPMPTVATLPERSGDPRVTLPTHYLRQFVALLKSRGVDTPALLQQLALQEPLPEQEDISLSWPQFYQLLHQSKVLAHEPALGLYLGSQLSISTHGLLGLVALSSADVQQALQLI